jgi:hypothetical protein
VIGFYVSVAELGGSKKGLALGPFDEHGQALFHVGRVRRFCRENAGIDDTWLAFGTARVDADRLPVGRLNDLVGVTLEVAA